MYFGSIVYPNEGGLVEESSVRQFEELTCIHTYFTYDTYMYLMCKEIGPWMLNVEESKRTETRLL